MRPMIRGAGGLFKPAPTPAPAATSPVDSPNTLRSKAIAEALLVIGEGPIVAPASQSALEQSVYLDGVPIRSSDGTLNFANVAVSLSLGYPDQAYVPGTSAAETTTAISTKITYAAPVVRTISDATATRGRFTLQIPALVRSEQDTGSRYGTSVSIAVDVQPDGGSYTTVVSDTISGKCVSPVQLDYDFALPGTGPWNVRARRLTEDSTSDYLQNETWWATLAEIRDYRLAYPNTALLRLRVDAEQFNGRFPSVSYEGRLLVLEIPSNYDPVARTYSGVWDGTFTTGWTDNPAWVLWALQANSRWGLGEYIGRGTVDKWSLYAAAQWFDELVSDGKGGLEPRYSFNGVIDSTIEAYRAITTIAGACQGMAYWSSGSSHLVIDRPVDPVKQVGPANVVDGRFVYQGSDLATRPTAVHVTWRDAANGYATAIECVEDPDLIARHGWRPKEVTAALCTSQGQAHRIGRHELLTAWRETQSASWQVGEDQQDIVPGDLVDVADPIVQGRQVAGRIAGVSGTTITLDRPVRIESGQVYELRLPGTDGVLQTRGVIAAPGETSVLTVASAFSPAPVGGAVWQLLASNLAPRRFRVIAIEEQDDGYAITAVLHDQNKQALIEGGVVLSLPAVTAYRTGPIDPPTDLVVDETIERLPSGTYRHRVTLGWAKHPDERVTRYEVQHRADGDGAWSDDGSAYGTTAELDELGGGSWEFRVRAVGFDGALSPWTSPIVDVLTGLYAAPPDVTNLTITVLDATALLAWATVTVANLDHYEVRYSADILANWQSMVPIAQRVSGTSVQTAARTGIYAVKAITAQAVESASATFVLCNVNGLTINVVETMVAHPTWPGTLVGTVFEDDRDALKLAPAGDLYDLPDLYDIADLYGFTVLESGTYTWPTYLDLGEVYTSRVSAALVAYGEVTTDDLWDELNVWSLATVWGENPTGWDAYVEVKTTNDDPSGSPTWTDWTRLVVSDLPFRAIWSRLVLVRGAPTITPIVIEASVIVDMADRIDAQGGLAVSSGGTRVSFTAAFRGPDRPSVVITGIEGAASGDWADVTNVDETGFDITVRDAGGVAQSGRSIDYHAKGYGKVITP